MKNLPMSSDSHDKERRSKVAFDSIVPSDLFIVRNEDGGDYGVDKILELKLLGTQMTNFRSYVQLKSTSSNKYTDGSYVFQVPINTINYLINQTNSIFVVYLETEKLFLWDWISEIVQYSESKGVNIQSTDNQTINYRFSKELNRNSFNSIHNQIKLTGTMVKQFSDYIKISNSKKTSSLAINISTESVTDAQHIVDSLKRYGIALSNEGDYSLLEKMVSQVPVQYKSDSDFCVVIAYFKYCNGDYYEALSWIPKGLKLNSVSENLKDLAEYIELILKSLLGIYNPTIFTEHFNNYCVKYPDSQITLQHRLFELKDKLINSDTTLKDGHRMISAELDDLIETIKKNVPSDSTFSILLELNEWELSGYQLIREITYDHFIMSGREKIGHNLPLEERVQKAKNYVEKSTKWYRQFETLYNSVKDEVIKARIYTSFSNLQMQLISNFRVTNKSNVDTDKEILENVARSLQYNIDILNRNGYLHELLRAQMSLAECYQGLGQSTEAIKIVNTVLVNAESIGLTNIVSYCKSFLEGLFIFNIEHLVLESMKSNVYLSDLSDKEMNKYVRQMAELLQLPSDRLPNLLIEYNWLRDDEVENITFCKHINTLQDLTHTFRIETKYFKNPDRLFICEKFKFQSSKGQDRKSILNKFKSNFCLTCKNREV